MKGTERVADSFAPGQAAVPQRAHGALHERVLRPLVRLRAAAPLIVLAAGAATAAEARQTGHTPYDSAYHAWDRGAYVESLMTLQRVLAGPDAAAWLEPIALLTGELFRSTELTDDGRSPRWSSDGRHFTFEHGAAESRAIVLHTFEAGEARRIAAMRGFGAAPAPAGDVAYLRGEEGAAVHEARAAVQQAVAAGDFAAARRQREIVAWLEAVHASVVVRNAGSGSESVLRTSGLALHSLVYTADGTLLLLAADARDAASPVHIYRLAADAAPVALTSEAAHRSNAVPLGRNALLYTLDGGRFGVLDVASGVERIFEGLSPSASADGRAIVFLRRGGTETAIHLWRVGESGDGRVVRLAGQPVANPVLSPSGERIAFQMMLRDDWDIFVIAADGSGEVRVTRDIQHDLMPHFLSETRLLAMMGEGRHRRSYLYDFLDGGTAERRRLFHNNTVRTVAPEYAWAPSPDGVQLLVVADRDGDTVSPERGVYLLDLGRRVTRDELVARVDRELAVERDLRARGRAMFAPIEGEVGATVADVAVSRIFEYAHDLYQFDSKFMTQPGNRLAIEYLERTLRSWGYDVELEWFEPRPGVRTANVVATLPGTVDPELIYIAGSHFDSVERGPGADDNSSGTTALLEAARVLRERPQPATLRFVFFTAEEAGLLGSREFARRALERGDRVMGALNNDMIGWTRSHRLDNTIRYSNRGIRDVQHAAAFLFTDLITYDSRYYQSTDAHALFDAFGDVIGGIGSYPILGNPHYHQAHDILEVIDQRLVAEVSKTTVATLMLLAASPSRIAGLEVAARRGDTVDLRWRASPERGITGYEVVWRGAGGEELGRTEVATTNAVLRGVPADASVAIRAIRDNGTRGWDWTELVMPR